MASRARILVVDDDQLAREELVSVLRNCRLCHYVVRPDVGGCTGCRDVPA